MKLSSTLFFIIGAASANAQTTYSVSTIYDFAGPNLGPSGIAVDRSGKIYASGYFTSSPSAPSIAQIFAPSSTGSNGSAVVLAGGTYIGAVDGTASAAQFSSQIADITTDSSGNIYVVDLGNSEVREVVPSTGIVTTLRGPAGATNIFGDPVTGVAVSASGNVYVVGIESSADDLFQYVPSATPTTILDTSSILIDGEKGELGAEGVAVDSANALYVTANYSSTFTAGPSLYVLKVQGNGSYTTLFTSVNFATGGSHASTIGSYRPITVDGSGNVYVAFGTFLYVWNSLSGQTYQVENFGGTITALATDSLGRVYVGYYGAQVSASAVGHIGLVTPSQLASPTATPTPTPPTQFVNISTRAFIGTGGSIGIAGFVISGTANEQVLIRAVGPTLAQFSVIGVLAQPVLTLFNSSGTQMATNTGWGTNANAAQISAAFASTGAFTLPSGSSDSALLLSLPPGAYTAQVSGLNNTTGNALIEAYQVPTPTPTPTP